MAEAQHRQDLAGYWPQISAKAGWFRTDEAPNFIFPALTMYIHPQTVNVPGGSATVTIPANAFGPDFPAATIHAGRLSGQNINTTAFLPACAFTQANHIANYDLTARLDPGKKIIEGHETLRWTNVSMEQIGKLHFHLYMNAFRNENSTFMKESGGQLRGDLSHRDNWGG